MKPISAVSQQLRTAFASFTTTANKAARYQTRALSNTKGHLEDLHKTLDSINALSKQLTKDITPAERKKMMGELQIEAQSAVRIRTKAEQSLDTTAKWTKELLGAIAKLLRTSREEPDWLIIKYAEEVRRRRANGGTVEGIASVLEIPAILVSVIIATTPASEAA